MVLFKESKYQYINMHHFHLRARVRVGECRVGMAIYMQKTITKTIDWVHWTLDIHIDIVIVTTIAHC